MLPVKATILKKNIIDLKPVVYWTTSIIYMKLLALNFKHIKFWYFNN